VVGVERAEAQREFLHRRTESRRSRRRVRRRDGNFATIATRARVVRPSSCRAGQRKGSIVGEAGERLEVLERPDVGGQPWLHLVEPGLLPLFSLAWLMLRRGRSVPDLRRLALAVAMVVAGVLHFVEPTPFLQHLPPWVPERELLVAVPGVAEVALGFGLLVRPPWRRTAGMLLALFLVAVFPANIYVAVTGVEVDGQPGGLDPWLRLLLQPVLVWLAVWSTRDRTPIDEPSQVGARAHETEGVR
jgi:uncharacterized membrane protein